jgi:sec-independent protein translocase protein TatA
MGNLGFPEILVILVIALIVFGPRKLPEIGKSLGRGIAEFKKASSDLAKSWEEEAAAEKKQDPPPVDKPGQ